MYFHFFGNNQLNFSILKVEYGEGKEEKEEGWRR